MPRDRPRRKRGHNQVAERTKRRRPTHSLHPSEVKRAKKLRDRGLIFQEIAGALGQPVRDVELALSNTRSRNPKATNAVINTDKLTKARFLSHRHPDDSREDAALVRLLDRAEACQCHRRR